MVANVATYTLPAGWTQASLADSLFGAAFANAGLMTAGEWHAQFVTGSNTVRVLRVPHDPTKAYGTTFYYFIFRGGDSPGISLASGWNTSTNVPTGTQYLDYHLLPSNVSNISANSGATRLCPFTPSTASAIYLDCYTSEFDTKQRWYVLRQGLNRSSPWTILHQNTVLQPWLDLSKGIINGYTTIEAAAPSRMGIISFQLQENLRRCLLTGSALRGEVTGASATFHGIAYSVQAYLGVGSASASVSSNLQLSGANGAAAFPLPVGKTSANGAFATDYIPIVSDLAWSPLTPTRLAADFGVYCHYADNTTAYGDKFTAQNGLSKWAALQFANNAVVVDGASPHFLASVPLNWELLS